MTNQDLKALSPEEGVDLYLDERKGNASYQTRQKIESVLDQCLAWTKATDLDDLNELDGRSLLAFKNWLKENTTNSKVSLNGILAYIRRFLVFLVQIEAVHETLPNKVLFPNVPKDEFILTSKPTDAELEKILGFLRNHRPLSRTRVEIRTAKKLACGLARFEVLTKLILTSRNEQFR